MTNLTLPRTASILRTLQYLMRALSLEISSLHLREVFFEGSDEIFSASNICKVLNKVNIDTLVIKGSPESLLSLEVPFIAHIESDANEKTTEFVFVVNLSKEWVRYYHPNYGIVSENLLVFFEKWTNVLILVDSSNYKLDQKFLELNNRYENSLSSYRDSIEIIPNFLNLDECKSIIHFSKDLKSKSLVLNDDGNTISSHKRTSESTSLCKLDPEIRQKMYCQSQKILGRRKYSEFEELQYVCYEKGQEFRPHFDASKHLNRLYTILVYLNEDFEGGETYFPEMDLKISPKVGSALLFKNIDDFNEIELFSLHSGLPVLSGVKHACNIWVR